MHNFKGGIEYITLSCLKYAEGGMSKAETLRILRENDIECWTYGAYTPYVGHYAVNIWKKDENKATKLLGW